MWRQPVIAASLVVKLWIRALIAFCDQPGGKHALQVTVERTRTNPYALLAGGGNFLHDGIPMAFAVDQGKQNVECRRGERRRFLAPSWHLPPVRRLFQPWPVVLSPHIRKELRQFQAHIVTLRLKQKPLLQKKA